MTPEEYQNKEPEQDKYKYGMYILKKLDSAVKCIGTKVEDILDEMKDLAREHREYGEEWSSDELGRNDAYSPC